MLEALFLALPVAVAYGWVMGRNSLRKAQRKQSSILSKHYYKGLNFLLSDQPDKAVDTLMKMISVNNDTIETHIAMGNFFRHRGELDRAIRVHQNLISKEEIGNEEISNKQEALALLELGTDYLLAGFLERAEGVFLQLLGQTQHFDVAQQKLFDIYQITKEWNKAIDLASASIQVAPNDKHLFMLLSHFYCEQAKALLEESKEDEAISLLKKAIVIESTQVRPWLDLGKLALESENFTEAFNYLSEIPKRDLVWLSEAIPLLETWAAKTDAWDQLEVFLEPYWQKCASSYIAKVNIIARKGDNQHAVDILNAQLQKHPTMRGFKMLLRLYQESFNEAEKTQESLGHLQSLLDKQIGQRPKYRCHSCGFSGRQLHWLCPSCKTWSSIKPIKGLDGE